MLIKSENPSREYTGKNPPPPRSKHNCGKTLFVLAREDGSGGVLRARRRPPGLRRLSAVKGTMAIFNSSTRHKSSVFRRGDAATAVTEQMYRRGVRICCKSHHKMVWGGAVGGRVSQTCEPAAAWSRLTAPWRPVVDKQDNWNPRCVWRKRRAEPTSYVARGVSGSGPPLACGVLGKALVC